MQEEQNNSNNTDPAPEPDSTSSSDPVSESRNTLSAGPSSTSGEALTDTGESTAYATKKDVKESQNLLLILMAGVVIFVAVTFWVELSAMHRNYNKDKTILLQNNELNEKYFDKVLFLNNEIQELKTEMELIKNK